MIQAPLGGCAFNNEFERPGIDGYFKVRSEIIIDTSRNGEDFTSQ